MENEKETATPVKQKDAEVLLSVTHDKDNVNVSLAKVILAGLQRLFK